MTQQITLDRTLGLNRVYTDLTIFVGAMPCACPHCGQGQGIAPTKIDNV